MLLFHFAKFNLRILDILGHLLVFLVILAKGVFHAFKLAFGAFDGLF